MHCPSKSVEQLMLESGLCLDHPAAARFHEHILCGEWVKVSARQDLQELKGLLDHPEDVTKMRFLLLEQKYLELLEDGRAIDALDVLRHQLTPLKHNVQRVHQLSSYIMCSTAEDLREQSGWPGAGAESRGLLMSRLQPFLPPSVMVPGSRLETLLQQSAELQRSRCPFHNTAADSADHGLLVDHLCSREQFPTETVQILRQHNDEVWFCKFSPDGRSLASGSKDSTIIVWDVDTESLTVKPRHTLVGHSDGPHGYPLCYLAWSPDSRYLLAAHESPEVRIWDAVQGTLEKSVNHASNDAIMCGAWHPDSTKFVCGGTHGQFYLFDIRGTQHDRWEGVRVRSLWFQNDGQTILAADTHNRVAGYYSDDPKPYEILTESGDVMSMCINDTGTLAALNVANQGVHLWDLQDKVLLRKFQGLTQGTFTVYGCFGGLNQEFVASGSEECNVYIWNTRREKPVAVLQGHTNTVNCVTWNPQCPSMLVSCSDDSTVRVWGPAGPHRAAATGRAAAASSGASDLASNGSSAT
ncbi:LOW QUALITY PROTEIN: WD repeat-containing protein 26-like [Pollicipes pollicipes]|uniref:LOW QUALITY PROTEIN: WD repeat-containing protein 26-like n=1 Tax=Pollicipes pollicipes TaxID=41117 RepID=UPI0018856973|nr:LOW QUALITY PROTEIN: WD repeat-containing protein 26-like [Pollicipes pollicipes]